MLCRVLNFDLKVFQQIEQRPGALNIIDYAGEASPSVIKMNDTSHLFAEETVPL